MTRVRKSQFIIPKELQRDFYEQLIQPGDYGYFERADLWAGRLRDLSPRAFIQICNVLASLGYTPDENDCIKELPWDYYPFAHRMDPIVYLSSIFGLRTYYPEENFIIPERKPTIRQKADILEIAIYLWAGIEPDRIDFDEVKKNAVEDLLFFCDLDFFMHRSNFSHDKEEVKEMFERGERIITPSKLADMFRKYKGRKKK